MYITNLFISILFIYQATSVPVDNETSESNKNVITPLNVTTDFDDTNKQEDIKTEEKDTNIDPSEIIDSNLVAGYDGSTEEVKDLSEWNGDNWNNKKNGRDGPLNGKRVNLYDYREMLHKNIADRGVVKTYNNRGVVNDARPKSMIPGFDRIRDMFSGRLKTNDKVIIAKSPYDIKFSLEGGRWKERDPDVYMWDVNNRMKDFNDLDERIKKRGVMDALKGGGIFIGYPAENLELKSESSDPPEVNLFRGVFKNVMDQFLDSIFDNAVAKFMAERVAQMVF